MPSSRCPPISLCQPPSQSTPGCLAISTKPPLSEMTFPWCPSHAAPHQHPSLCLSSSSRLPPSQPPTCRCVAISTDSSLSGIISPGWLVMLSPTNTLHFTLDPSPYNPLLFLRPSRPLRCVAFSTESSLSEMIPRGALVMLLPTNTLHSTLNPKTLCCSSALPSLSDVWPSPPSLPFQR